MVLAQHVIEPFSYNTTIEGFAGHHDVTSLLDNLGGCPSEVNTIHE